MSALTPAQWASLGRAVTRRSGGQVMLPPVALSKGEAIALWHDLAAAFAPSAGRMLSARERHLLKTRAWRKSAGYAALRSDAMSIACGLAFWRVACRLGTLAERRPRSALGRSAGIAAMSLAATQLAACTSLFGGNIRGSFACSAPGGTCAPSTLIDDQALSVIQNARPLTPAQGTFGMPERIPVAARIRAAAVRVSGGGRYADAGNGMVHRERRVLRVVFPSFVDGGGNLHEPRIVHAVVDDGAWMQLTSGVPVLGPPTGSRLSDRDQLPAVAALAMPAPTSGEAEAATRQATTTPSPSAPPSAAAVAAARAKGEALKSGSVIDAIRADVEARLAQTAKSPGLARVGAVSRESAAQAAAQSASPAASEPNDTPATGPRAFSGKVEE